MFALLAWVDVPFAERLDEATWLDETFFFFSVFLWCLWRFTILTDELLALCDFCDAKLLQAESDSPASNVAQIKLIFFISITPQVKLLFIMIHETCYNQFDQVLINDQFA